MTGKVITLQQLINASYDADSLADIINGAAWVEIETRLGRKCYSIATINAIITRLLEKEELGEAQIAQSVQNIADKAAQARVDIDTLVAEFDTEKDALLVQLQDAIDVALAAGAGAAGWTDSLVQTESGLTQRVENRAFVSSVSSVSDFGSIFALDKRIVFLKDGARTGLFQYNASDSSTAADNGIYIRDSKNRLWTRLDFDVIKPQYYGITESTPDPTELLRAMHATANKLGVSVTYSGLKNLNVQANARIYVNTNVDFAGCRFDLLNGIVLNPTWNGSTYRLFIVKDPNRTITTFNLNPSELFQGAKQITVPDTAIEGYLFLESDKRIGNRTSAPTTNLYFKQSFTLSGGGILNYPLIKDLTSNTATATLYNDPSKKWITIKGLYADISKFNNQCLLDVQRNYTRVAELAFERNVKDTSANAESLIWFTYCSIVIFENSRSVAPQIRDGVTTSGLSIGYCSDVVLRNLYGLDKESWGFTTTNFVTGLVTENCHIGRMDNHQGCMFWRIIGGSLHNKAIQYSWGGGFLDVDGLTVTNKEILLARNDYDNDFDGHISLRNIKWILNDPASMDTENVDNGSGAVTRYIGHIFSCYQAGTTSTDGGNIIPVKLADSIHIENLEIIAPNIPEGQLTINAINFDLIDASAIVRMPHTIKIRNVHSDKNRFYFTMAKGRYYKAYPYYSNKDGIYRDTIWKFRDIDSLYCNGRRHGFIEKSGANEQVSAFTQFAAQSKTFQFKFDDCTGVVLDYTMPNAVYRVNNCDIGALNFGAVTPSNANCTVNASRMVNTVRTEAGNGRLGQIGTGAAECKLNNVEVLNDVNPVFMSAVIGVVFKTSATVNWSSTTIPQLTYAQMFDGWYSTSIYK